MKNFAMPMAIATVGLGLLSIGFNLNGNTANATPVAFNAGPAEPTIVWYDAVADPVVNRQFRVFRAWTDGTVEMKWLSNPDNDCTLGGVAGCGTGWHVIASPNEGLNAFADLNFDERVDAADIGLVLAAWGDAPRNDYPPSDCPLGLIP